MRTTRSCARCMVRAGERKRARRRACSGGTRRSRRPRSRRRAPRSRGRGAPAAAAAIAWLGGTIEFARARIAPGPRTFAEVATMMATSVAIPFAATYHFLRGWAAVPGLLARKPRPRAVLLDRDGTLVHDVPF